MYNLPKCSRDREKGLTRSGGKGVGGMTAKQLESDVSIMIQKYACIRKKPATYLAGMILSHVFTHVIEVLSTGESASEPTDPVLLKDDPRCQVKAGG